MRFAGFEYRFFADDAFAIDDFNFVQRIEYFPMARGELHRIFAMVFDRNFIAERKMDLVVLEEGAFKTRQNRNFNSSGDLSNHVESAKSDVNSDKFTKIRLDLHVRR